MGWYFVLLFIQLFCSIFVSNAIIDIQNVSFKNSVCKLSTSEGSGLAFAINLHGILSLVTTASLIPNKDIANSAKCKFYGKGGHFFASFSPSMVFWTSPRPSGWESEKCSNIFDDLGFDVTIVAILQQPKKGDQIQPFPTGNISMNEPQVLVISKAKGSKMSSLGSITAMDHEDLFFYESNLSKVIPGAPLLSIRSEEVVGIHHSVISNKNVATSMALMLRIINADPHVAGIPVYRLFKEGYTVDQLRKYSLKQLVEGGFKYDDIISANISVYEGDSKESKENGIGFKVYPNGYYEGDWVNGHEEGSGKFTWNDGSTFSGQLTGGHINGRGLSKYPDGSSYHGQFKDGFKEGKGRFTFSDGSVYDGDWKHGKVHGHGVMTKKDGSMYDGDFVDGNRHGKGAVRDQTYKTHLNLNIMISLYKSKGNTLIPSMMPHTGKLSSSEGTVYDGEWRFDEKYESEWFYINYYRKRYLNPTFYILSGMYTLWYLWACDPWSQKRTSKLRSLIFVASLWFTVISYWSIAGNMEALSKGYVRLSDIVAMGGTAFCLFVVFLVIRRDR